MVRLKSENGGPVMLKFTKHDEEVLVFKLQMFRAAILRHCRKTIMDDFAKSLHEILSPARLGPERPNNAEIGVVLATCMLMLLVEVLKFRDHTKETVDESRNA